MYAYIKPVYNNIIGGDIMASASSAQKKATRKYISEKTDEVQVRVPKGKKAEYMKLAAAQGQSLNAVINRLLQDWQQITTNNNK